jgi:hypothetical protein
VAAELVLGERGASEVEQLVVLIGFPIAAIYLAWLLIEGSAERRRSPEKTDS